MSSPDAHASASAGLLSDATLAALELRRQPFGELAADGDTYTDDTTAEQLADIRQALIAGDDLLLILGPPGAGKTVLLGQLAANSGQRIQCFSVRGSPRFSAHNLFAGMLEAFREAPPEELRDVLDALLPHLQGMAADNLLCTIVLDDADRVAEPELTRLLSGMLYLNSRDETLLRIALSAEEAFEERIPELLPEGADLPYSGLVVEPFGAERAAGYLDFRLNQAGRFDAFPFSDRETESINARAGGLPGALHVEAARELESRHGSGADDGDDDDLPAELVEHARRGGTHLLDARGAKLGLGALALALILGGLLLSRPSPETPADEARFRVVEERPVTAVAADPAPDPELVRELADARRSEPVVTEPLDGTAPAGGARAAVRPGAADGASVPASEEDAAQAPPAPAPGTADDAELALAEPAAAPEAAPRPAPAPTSAPTSAHDIRPDIRPDIRARAGARAGPARPGAAGRGAAGPRTGPRDRSRARRPGVAQLGAGAGPRALHRPDERVHRPRLGRGFPRRHGARGAELDLRVRPGRRDVVRAGARALPQHRGGAPRDRAHARRGADQPALDPRGGTHPGGAEGAVAVARPARTEA